jgi:hypothetical protein
VAQNKSVFASHRSEARQSGAGRHQFWYMPGRLPSTANVRNASGNAVASYSYDAFGAPTVTADASENYFRFTGEQVDSESGYDYLRARDGDRPVLRVSASATRCPIKSPAKKIMEVCFISGAALVNSFG